MLRDGFQISIGWGLVSLLAFPLGWLAFNRRAALAVVLCGLAAAMAFSVLTGRIEGRTAFQVGWLIVPVLLYGMALAWAAKRSRPIRYLVGAWLGALCVSGLMVFQMFPEPVLVVFAVLGVGIPIGGIMGIGAAAGLLRGQPS